MSASYILRGAPLASGRRVVGGAGTEEIHPLRPTVASGSGMTAPAANPAAAESHRLLMAAERERTVAEGRAEGLKEGLAQAAERIEREVSDRYEQARARLEEQDQRRADEHRRTLAALDDVLKSIGSALPARWAEIEHQAVELAYEALCRMAGPQPASSAVLADVIRHGMLRARGQALLSVRLHPLDLTALGHEDAGRKLIEQHAPVRWTADPSIERGGCVIDTNHGQLDVGLSTQLERLRDLWAAGTSAAAPGPEARNA